MLLALSACTADETTAQGSTSTSSEAGEASGHSDGSVSGASVGSSGEAPGASSSSSVGPTASCDDGEQNGSETDVDCGNACGATCEIGEGCEDAEDCVSGFCDPQMLRCAAPFVCPNDEDWSLFLPQDRQRANPDDVSTTAPVVVAAADGRYAVGWTAGSQGTFAVHLQQYAPSGRPSGGMAVLSDPSHFVTRAPALAMNASGELVFSYLGDTMAGSGPFVGKYEEDGTVVLPPTLASPPEHYLGSLTPDVAIADDGSFVVAWTPTQSAPQSVWIQPFSPDGSTSAQAVQVSPPEQVVLARPTVDMSADGRIIAAWHVEEEQTCYARRIGADGQPLEDAWRVTPDGDATQDPCGVAMGQDGRFAMTWVRDGVGDGVLRSYASDGSVLGTADIYAGGLVFVDYPSAWHPSPVSVDINGDSNIVVGYTLDKVHTGWARTFDAQAEPLIDPVLVTGNNVLGSTPDVAAASCADAFVVGWIGGSGGAALSRLFLADDDDDGLPDLCCE